VLEQEPRLDDEVLEALSELLQALDENARAAGLIRERAEVIRARRLEGRSYMDIVDGESRPLIVELVTGKLDRLFKAGNRMRRAEAAALYAEGLSMERIAATFGVTRQRVSQLLSERSQDGTGNGR